MRDYGKVSPLFWTGETGRELRKLGRDEQLLALFLVTGPTANMIGIYHLPVSIVAFYLGMTEQGALKALRRVSETGFCSFEASKELIWVPEMAAQQIGEPLKATDNRVTAIHKEVSTLRKCCFYKAFYSRYKDSFHLEKLSPFEAPSKPLRSQEQEQEQEQEKEQDKERAAPSVTSKHQNPKEPFRTPTVEEVRTYCRERSNSVDPEQFIDHYTANGWKQGRGKPILDWKAAVRTWEKNNFNGTSKKPATVEDEYPKFTGRAAT